MPIKESDLTTISETEFTAVDYVRVLDGDSSRKITLTNFGDSISPVLTALGFSNTGDPVVHIVTASSNYNITSTNRIILVDTSGGDVGINLPTAASTYTAATTSSLVFTIKKITTDVNKVNIVPPGVETIDGNTAYNIVGPSLGTISVASNGSNWFVVSA